MRALGPAQAPDAHPYLLLGQEGRTYRVSTTKQPWLLLRMAH